MALLWQEDSDEGIPQPYVSQMKVWVSPGVSAPLLPERIFCFEFREWLGRTKGGDENSELHFWHICNSLRVCYLKIFQFAFLIV